MPPKEIQESITALGVQIAVTNKDGEDYISLTDIARYKSDEPSAVIANWMRSRNTVDFLGVWETLHNPNFNSIEFEGIEQQAGKNAFTMSPRKWIKATNAIGIRAKGGRYGGAFAHTDIALDFAAWISPEFRLYVFKDYQRLKLDENSRLNPDWNVNRMFSRMNYRMHTDAVKENLIPHISGERAKKITYATEADVLNVAVFGMTAKQWRESHPNEDGNVRDHATTRQLLVLANLETMNAELIRDGWDRASRVKKLNDMGIRQMKSLEGNPTIRRIEDGQKQK